MKKGRLAVAVILVFVAMASLWYVVTPSVPHDFTKLQTLTLTSNRFRTSQTLAFLYSAATSTNYNWYWLTGWRETTITTLRPTLRHYTSTEVIGYTTTSTAVNKEIVPPYVYMGPSGIVLLAVPGILAGIAIAFIYWPKPRKATEPSVPTLPQISVSEEPETAASYCPTCKRTSNHVHYSSWHEGAATSGVILVLVAEGIAFISGFVQGSTLLYLDYASINAYEAFGRAISELTAPFEYLTNIAIVFDVAVLATVIAVGATLYSSSKIALHRVGAVIGPVFLASEMATNYYYYSLVDEALSNLPSKLSSGTLQTAIQVQARFDAAYGFWGAPSDSAKGLITIVGLIALVISAATYSRMNRIWKQESPTVAPAEATVPPVVSPIEETQVAPSLHDESARPTKFCRYCGATIVRESKFCEECGKNLV